MEIYVRVAELARYRQVLDRLAEKDEALRASCVSAVGSSDFKKHNTGLSDEYLRFYLKSPFRVGGSQAMGSFEKFALSVLGFRQWSFRGGEDAEWTVALGERDGGALDALLQNPWFYSLVTDEQRMSEPSLGGHFVFLQPREVIVLRELISDLTAHEPVARNGSQRLEAVGNIAESLAGSEDASVVLDVYSDE